MRSAFFCAIAILGLLIGNAFAGEVRTVKLNDGSIIVGDVLALTDGIYTVKTISLGTLKIKESEINSIRSIIISKDEIQKVQNRLENNEELLSKIIELQNDPDFQLVMKDPSIIEAVNSGDMNSLLSNPKFMKLLNNPKIRDIRNKLEK